jgi:chemotaxis protein MotB
MARKLQAGTWKIAYADFITALMVLFLMLWLVGAIPESDLKGISEYFSETNQNLNQLPQNIHKQDSHLRDNQDLFASNKDLSSNEKEMLSKMLQSIKDSEAEKEFADNFCVYWHNGVVIELFDTYNRPLFVSSTANLQPWAVKLVEVFGAKVLKHQKDYIVIEGHAALGARSSDCWNLSFCRANVVRRYLGKYLRSDQILKVTGNGDMDLIDKSNPDSPVNMRISIILLDKNFVHQRQRSLPN